LRNNHLPYNSATIGDCIPMPKGMDNEHQNCLFHPRGARVMPPGAGAAQKTACPQGTVYNPRRGTCKVMPTIAGTP
jgi:hypothetical protein